MRLAEALGLSADQIQQIRLLNQKRRPEMQNAQLRFQLVKEELDEYVYSDSINETTLQTKLRAVVEAQAEITKIRLMSEMAVRNVLTPAQLVKFRDLRDGIKQQRRLNNQKRQQRQNRRLRNQNQRDRLPQDRPVPPRNRQ
jgi:Spy/CpxP family protein refolding chaperone